ncbi:T9SS type B sorting domain-containing protein [Flavobacterium sp.]|uniref:T9SS type B sorting domain-containing protein n=1 Tax=Flavobacterium sp. TaxID=239 RepID=UPI003526DC62
MKNIQLLLFLLSTIGFSQNLPNDCVNYIQACGDQAVSYNVSGSGVQEIIPMSCSSQENNSLWLRVTIDQGGTLGFTLIPQSTSIAEDYDFWVFGPVSDCSSLGTPIRCSTTNPQAAGQVNNHTGLNSTSTDTQEGPGADGDSFVRELLVASGQSYFIVIDRPIGNSAFDLTWSGTATILNPFQNITFNDFPEVTLCDEGNDNVEFFDFDSLTNNYINGNSNFSVAYFSSEEDATFNNNPLLGNTLITSGTYYARVGFNTSGCFEVKEISVVFQNISAQDYETSVCEEINQNYAIVDLSAYESFVYTGNLAVTYSYYTTLSDAENMQAPVTNWQNLQLPVGIHTFYTRVEKSSDCFDVAELKVEVLQKPIINLNVQLKQCDDNTDGFSAFNLFEANVNIIANPEDFTFVYFYTVTDAEANTNPIPNATNFVNQTVATQTIFFRVTNNNSGCAQVGELQLLVGTSQIPSSFQPLQFYSCDVSYGTENDQIGIFDFSSATSVFTNYFTTQTVSVTYYETLADALQEINVIVTPDNYINTTNNQEIIVRIDSDINNDCIGLGNYIQLNVMPIPVKTTSDSVFFCVNNASSVQLNAGLLNGFSASNYTYQWYFNNVPVSNANQYTISVNEIGNYEVEITDSNNCVYYHQVTVTGSETAQIETVQIFDVTDVNQITIIANGIGDYEYSIDAVNYQDSPTFVNVPYGTVTVYVKDKNGCGVTLQDIVVLGFPQFFTPNGDGINDYWNVVGINKRYSTPSIISVFDRYGKLISQFTSTSAGWNGTYNGKKLPATDYWCVVELPDGKTYKGHFALIR